MSEQAWPFLSGPWPKLLLYLLRKRRVVFDKVGIQLPAPGLIVC